MRRRLEGRLSDEEQAWLGRLGEVAEAAGAKAYLVGGPVRDLILGRPSPDTDLAVEGSVEAVVAGLVQEFGGRIKKTTDFLTATVRLGDEREIDVAHTRTETYPEPGALPVVLPAPLEDDLRRRDFTVNAMALALAPGKFGELIDPHAGYADLEAGLLRVLHERSFEDDPTRMLRAVRFRQRLGFGLDPHTRELLLRAADEGALSTVSGARLRGELRTIFLEAPSDALTAMQELHLLEAMGLPPAGEVAMERAQRLPAAARALGMELEEARPISVCLGLCAAGAGVDGQGLGERLMLDAAERKDLSQAARLASDPPPALTTDGADSELYFALEGTTASGSFACWVALPDEARPRLERYWRELRPMTADIDGKDLIAEGYEPGPDFAEALRVALAVKIDRDASRDEQLREAGRILDAGRDTGEG